MLHNGELYLGLVEGRGGDEVAKVVDELARRGAQEAVELWWCWWCGVFP